MIRRLGLSALLLASACTKAQAAHEDPVEAAAKLLGAPGSSKGIQTVGAGPERPLRPVYAENQAADPLAEELCTVLHTLPAKKRAACAGSQNPGFLVTPECTRNVSAALAGKAIRIEREAVHACRVAMESALQSCDFAKVPFGSPLPAACDHLVMGSLDDGAICRSSLECKDGLQCFGVGPMDAGRCRVPAPVGTICGAAVDPLVVYARQDSAEASHPACDGYCAHHRCTALVKPGEACSADVQCGPEKTCDHGKCG
ncbi:MAG: hypothetical protein U1E65_06865 [Myxococcota bacterium]